MTGTSSGPTLESFLRLPARWIGVMGSVRHTAPHVPALRQLGVPDEVIGRIRRPSASTSAPRPRPRSRCPPSAGLIADRNRRPGGFAF